MRIFAAGATDVGRVRTSNEDAYLLDTSRQLYAVADGMGGHRAGEVASATAIEALAVAYQPGQVLEEAIVRANDAVVERAATDSELTGMGTTLTALALDGDRAVIAHVGDSRAYLLRDGEMIRVTEDHSLVEQYVREGRLTPEQAEVHPQRSVITRALGIDVAVVVDRYEVDLLHGDRFVICSDGLTTMVREAEIAALAMSEPDPQQAAQAFVAAANGAGGDDNVTVVVVDVVDDVGGPPRQAISRPASVPGPPSLPGPAPADPSAVPSGSVVNPARGASPASGAARADVSGARADGRRPRGLRGQRRRGRHPIRILLLSLPVLVVVAAGVGILAWYARGTFYVGAAGERVAVFRGVSGGLLGWAPTVERQSELRLAELTQAERVAVEDEARYADLEEALRYVGLLESEVRGRRGGGQIRTGPAETWVAERLAGAPSAGSATTTAPDAVLPAQPTGGPTSGAVTSGPPVAPGAPRR